MRRKRVMAKRPLPLPPRNPLPPRRVTMRKRQWRRWRRLILRVFLKLFEIIFSGLVGLLLSLLVTKTQMRERDHIVAIIKKVTQLVGDLLP